MLLEIRKFVCIGVLRLLYFSFVHCHLQRCFISWDTVNKSVLSLSVCITKQHITDNDFQQILVSHYSFVRKLKSIET